MAVIAGIASGLLSAVATAFLLLINGSLTLVVLGSVATSTPTWLVREGFLQFILFLTPLVMVVIEWMVWDALCDFTFRSGRD